MKRRLARLRPRHTAAGESIDDTDGAAWMLSDAERTEVLIRSRLDGAQILLADQ